MSKKDINPTFATITSSTRITVDSNVRSEPNQRERFMADLRKATRRTGDESGREPKRTSE